MTSRSRLLKAEIRPGNSAGWPNLLRGLPIAEVVQLTEAGSRGEWAVPQKMFEAVERLDAATRALVSLRVAKIKKLDWGVARFQSCSNGADPDRTEAQRGVLSEWYGRISNLREAVGFLVLADFRGYAHLQITSQDGQGNWVPGLAAAVNSRGSIRLEPLPQRCWVRDGSTGDWGWNPGGRNLPFSAIDPRNVVGSGLRREDFLIREVADPIDSIALLAFSRKGRVLRAWREFMARFGLPSFVVVPPPDTTGRDTRAYRLAAEKVADGYSGVLPHGAAVLSPREEALAPGDGDDGENESGPFLGFLEWIEKDTVLAGTGGMLTMLARRGCGRMLGETHAKGLRDIVQAEAMEISELLRRQFDAAVLKLPGHGSPLRAGWELEARTNEERSRWLDRAEKLHKAGFELDLDEVQRWSGLKKLTRKG